MRLKYYLRGAGCGILISAILFAALLTALDWGPKSDSSHGSKGQDNSKVLVGDTAADAGEASKSQEKKQVEEEEKYIEKDLPGEDSASSEDGSASKGDAAVASAGNEEDDGATSLGDGDGAVAGDAADGTGDKGGAAAGGEDIAATSGEDAAAAGGEGTAGVADAGSKIHFVIKSGEGSYTVASNLVKAGIINDAGDFDEYLSRIGYDNVLCTGEYDIEPGLEYREIANILTRR